jgi:hypothetical protein
MLTRAAKSVAVILGHTVVAVIGTAIISTSLGKLFHATSGGGVIRKEWILSLICAAAIGLMMYRTWRSRLGVWAWVLPSALFALGVLAVYPSGNYWYQLSGSGCASTVSLAECRYFFVFTVPFIRSIAYSVGTLLGLRVWPGMDRSKIEVKAVAF